MRRERERMMRTRESGIGRERTVQESRTGLRFGEDFHPEREKERKKEKD